MIRKHYLVSKPSRLEKSTDQANFVNYKVVLKAIKDLVANMRIL